jgi:hypothetical protein
MIYELGFYLVELMFPHSSLGRSHGDNKILKRESFEEINPIGAIKAILVIQVVLLK